MERVIRIIQQDRLRLAAIDALYSLNLPDGYLAAGFVRNAVWDYLHSKSEPTELNDVDVIYFDAQEAEPDKYRDYELSLSKLVPSLNWQVRNQALMHIRNDDAPYKSSLNAMSYWPEKETAVGIRKLSNGRLDCISAFGFDSLFNLELTHNNKRSLSVFEERVKSKGWLGTWPSLNIVY
ncbi:nucleotidyltransferase family protein [Reinekea thalattae]|uniref:Nucleotidyltransferase family protein n=1 Tax=Reinekea thalattae TaxID=2593301 RepID=A0A5C8Z6W2_9GAMM|nr:nucleotidyltransferase family protein [Reinekea thalattae]TXR53835.1 nucleotidyltransferase family protein [Reinekea thalattae]